MSIRVGIVGISGFGGGEAMRLIASHPSFELVYAAGEGSAGSRLADRFPGVPAKLAHLVIAKWDPAALPKLDVLFASLPTGASAEALARVPENVKVVDIGGDHRFVEHWAYGLADVWPDQIRDQRRIANPGCFPAATLTALAPLLGAGLIEPSNIIIDAKTGISGAGRGGDSKFIPKDLPPRSTAYGDFSRWRDAGLLARIDHHLVMADRERVGREASPSAAVLDSQSVKTAESGGPRGYDAGRKGLGRKRQTLVDTDGRALVLDPQPADVQDRDGAVPVLRLSRRTFPFVARAFADAGYVGERPATATIVTVEIVRKPPDRVGFAVHPRRWVVERVFAWISRNVASGRTLKRPPPRPKPSSRPPPSSSSCDASPEQPHCADGL